MAPARWRLHFSRALSDIFKFFLIGENLVFSSNSFFLVSIWLHTHIYIHILLLNGYTYIYIYSLSLALVFLIFVFFIFVFDFLFLVYLFRFRFPRRRFPEGDSPKTIPRRRFPESYSPKAIPRRRSPQMYVIYIYICIVFARSWGPGGALSTELLIDRCRAGAYARTYACARVKLLAKYEFRRFKLGISTSEIRISKFEIQNFVCEFWISVFEISPQGYQYIPCQVGCRKWLERAAHLSRKYAAR